MVDGLRIRQARRRPSHQGAYGRRRLHEGLSGDRGRHFASCAAGNSCAELAIELHGKPERLVCDNGPEFTSLALDTWAASQRITLHPIEPGKPVQNAFIESFNGCFRDECLNQNQFLGLHDARKIVEAHRQDYNTARPHTSLGGKTPEEFVRGFAGGMPPAKPNPNPQLQPLDQKTSPSGTT